jgi:hypothetical protein
MSEREVHPDPVVRTAVQMLPTPDHREGFWSELHALLDAEPPRSQASDAQRHLRQRYEPGLSAFVHHEPQELELLPVAPLGVVPPALRRRSNVVLSAVAVAAAVLVVVAGASLVREHADGDAETTDMAGSAAASSTSATSSPAVASLTGEASDIPADAVLGWVGALEEGDTTTAWEALGPASQAHFGSRSEFAAEASALAEGYGAWSGVEPDEVIVTPVQSSGDAELVVVTLVGEIEQEGTLQHRADAFPVRILGGAAQVEPWGFAGELEVVVPEAVPADGARPVVDGDDELVVVVPRGVEAPIIRLDDGEALVCGEADGTELEVLSEVPGQRCSYRPEGGIDPGHRVLTVAFASADGDEVSAESVLFKAA